MIPTTRQTKHLYTNEHSANKPVIIVIENKIPHVNIVISMHGLSIEDTNAETQHDNQL